MVQTTASTASSVTGTPRAGSISTGRMKAANSNGTTTNGTPTTNGHHGPVSSRKAKALDMNTVEQKGSYDYEQEPRGERPFGLTEAPTFRPTVEEWKDPFKYIESIREEGSKYGIIKVIPPEVWTPEFAIDTTAFHFRTRRQELNSVEGGTRSNLYYLDQLHKFHKQQGSNLTRFPSVDKRPLDLYRLKKAVEVRGGFDSVCKHKKWAEIGRDLGYSGKIMSSLSTSLKNSYQRYLQPYEDWVKTAKPEVQRQLEAEFGVVTPSPSASPMKQVQRNHSKAPDSPNTDTAMSDSTPVGTPRPEVGGFTAVNSGQGSFTPIKSNGVRREAENGLTPTRSHKNSPDIRDRGSALKRQLSHESSGESSPSKNGEGSENGERRSKRLKKEPAPTVAGSHMTLHRPATPRMAADRTKKLNPGEKCETCGRGDDAVNLLLCDGCDYGYHTYCLDPPVRTIPERDWYCNRCLVGTGEFGFADGEIYSLRQFQERANTFREKHFAGKGTVDKDGLTEDDVEREFWRLVEDVNETVEVEYGADIHSTTHGSGFPTIERQPLDPYSTDPWNLNVMPLHQDSLFRHIKSDVSGMTVPWLYVGMVFSTFCWHNEDHYTYSANYQHFGATKTWYGIPGSDALKFEEAMKEAVPELFEQQPDLLFQLVTLLTPAHLMKAGVKVYAIDQHAGEFVITFPQAYHAGFNHGFNFNEAVNFAPSDWEPYGQAGVERYQEFRKAPVFSHDELLLTAAARDITIKTAKWLGPALARIRDREIGERNLIREAIPDLNEELYDEDLPEDQYQCGVCKVYCYLSQVTCSCTSNVTCPTHFRDICDCEASQLTLRLRHSDESLDEIVNRIQERANLPNAWTSKLQKVMTENARPALKTLRSLLLEGERIPYTIPEVPNLKTFVERAHEWVEEANNFIARKQQNRRKNEKLWRKGTARAAELEEKDKEHRKFENMLNLLSEADKLFFDCPEIEQLRERADAIKKFQRESKEALSEASSLPTSVVEELVETGKSFNVDLPETELLEKFLQQLKWTDKAKENRLALSLSEVEELIAKGKELGIPENHEQLNFLLAQKQLGELWDAKANELVAAEAVHFQQLEALASQAATLPTIPETVAKVEYHLETYRKRSKQIMEFLEKTQAPDPANRPAYKDARDVIDSLVEYQGKPAGAVELERELKRHEDWMRKGKKLFGKANAPLHILMLHMDMVQRRNERCFDIEDRPRTPVEPSSREQSPAPSFEENNDNKPREVFCICRQPEHGMMIECEICHEWYHGRCLKIARGKIKEEDKYTCPICDYRVKIPRDARRPKLEDLIDWHSEITTLPFFAEEQEAVENIIDTATKFREFIRPFSESPLGVTSAEVPTMRFYLRKIEGAEVLLAQETNFFRAELHKWMPIAPEPPPIIDVSLSTRKPRPTKQQKLMAQLGITNPEELPPTLRTKPHTFKKKPSETPTKDPIIKPAPTKNEPPSNPSDLSLAQQQQSDHPVTSLPPHFPEYAAQFTLAHHIVTTSTNPGETVYGLMAPAMGSISPPTSAALNAPLYTHSFDNQGPMLSSPGKEHLTASQNHALDNMFEALTNQEEYGNKDSQGDTEMGEAQEDKELDKSLADQFLESGE